MNVFQGSRRIGAVLGGLWVIGCFVALLNASPYTQLTYEVTWYNAPPRLKMESGCASTADATEYISRSLPRGGRVNVTLCFRATEAKDGSMVVPYAPSEQEGFARVADQYSSEVGNYTERVADKFSLDAIGIAEGTRRYKADLASARLDVLKALVGGVGVGWVLMFVLGWIVRGFMGIPAKADTKEPPARRPENAHATSAPSKPSETRIPGFIKDFDAADKKLTDALEAELSNYLSRLASGYQDAFNKIIQREYSAFASGEVEAIEGHLEHLAEQLGKWPSLASERIRTTCLNDGEPLYDVFFAGAAAASNYEAIITRRALEHADNTYDKCLASVASVASTAASEQIKSLDSEWNLVRWRIQLRIRDLYVERCRLIWSTMSAHGDSEAVVRVFHETVGGLASLRAWEDVRLFRRTFGQAFYTFPPLEGEAVYRTLIETADEAALGFAKDLEHDPTRPEDRSAVGAYVGLAIFWFDKREECVQKSLADGREKLGEFVDLARAKSGFEAATTNAVNYQFDPILAEALTATREKLAENRPAAQGSDDS